ncbi:hypothetical protein ACFQ21_04160 [Ohtaekwangia kribbensis]|uniref:G-D-S-L family lipolytic protein n=1 Tax=Ohtaekwangia kribbensis TaxID=688913 RepID=A0ABW3JXB1_9BACT
MKKINYRGYTLSLLLLLGACSQEDIDLQAPETTTDTSCEDATAGSADFSKFVVIGDALTAGFQAGALFTEGQNNSLGKILNKQFECAGGSATFNQPDINSVNGFNSTNSNVGAGVILGRLVLFDADGSGSKTASPTPAGYPGVPAPYNTADLPTAYTGDKSKLNNFGVPGIILGQILTAATGGPNSQANPAYNGLYARFASVPGTSTILGDAIGAQGTFFLFWAGNGDVLAYAVAGGSGPVGLTSIDDFSAQYNFALNGILGSNSNLKGVVGNIPDVATIPHFTTVKWNAIPLDAATAATVTTNLANNYNGFLDQIASLGIITAAERDLRKVSYAAGQNSILLTDETLTDLSPYMQGEAAALLPYAKARQTKNTDLVPLSAGAILGTTVGGNAQMVYGVTVPLEDKYILTSTEVTEIRTRTTALNNIIKGTVESNSRLALADVNATFSALVTATAEVKSGVTITPTLTPPTGAFSEDGIHPNSRGYAYVANIFINAINAKFGSTVPQVNLGLYKGTGLPVSPQ